MRVGEEARQVGEVLRLAVAVLQAAEDAEHLQVALQAHPFDRAVELAEVVVDRQAGLARRLPVAHRQVEHELLVPGEEGVAHQAGDVVGDRAVHRVLEVEHAGVRGRATIRLRGMKSRCTDTLRLGQRAVDEQVAG